jgi:hypothetical protein
MMQKPITPTGPAEEVVKYVTPSDDILTTTCYSRKNVWKNISLPSIRY